MPLPVEPRQLSLLGEERPVRIEAQRWREWIGSRSVVARFMSLHFQLSDAECWPWLGAVSSTGHGSFRAASLEGVSRRGTVPAHLFAYQLAYGVIPRWGWAGTDDVVVCHQCDYGGCVNPRHMQLGTVASNNAEYAARRRDVHSPLADVRGAAGRSRAIGAAVRAAVAAGGDIAEVRRVIAAADAAGRPCTLW